MNISPSCASTFRQCPYKWFLQYKKWIRIPSNIYLKRGSFVHEILREYAEHLMGKRIERDMEKLAQIIIKNKKIKEYQDFTEEDWNMCVQQVKDYAKEGIKYKDIQRAEHSFKFWIPALSINITGRIDRIDMTENKKKDSDDKYTIAVIRDYKTGKADIESNLIRTEGFIFYSWAAKKIVERADEIWVEFLFLKTGEKVKLRAMDSDDAWKEIEKRATEIINAKKYPKNETGLCDYCDFRKHGHCKKKEEVKQTIENKQEVYFVDIPAQQGTFNLNEITEAIIDKIGQRVKVTIEIVKKGS